MHAEWLRLKEELWGKPGTWINQVWSPRRQAQIEVLRLGRAADALLAPLNLSSLAQVIVRQQYYELLEYITTNVKNMSSLDIYTSFNRGLVVSGQPGIGGC